MSGERAAALADLDRFLLLPTPEAWLCAARAQVPVLLNDHASCEKKAASTALSLSYRGGFDAGQQQALSRLAREELRHFEQVLDLMARLGVPFESVSASRYAGRLRAAATGDAALHEVALLLVCAVVEARSCERFARLVPVLEAPVADFYRKLLASEARHFRFYLDLAEARARAAGIAPSTVRDVQRRVLAADAAAVMATDRDLRFHSGVPPRVVEISAAGAR